MTKEEIKEKIAQYEDIINDASEDQTTRDFAQKKVDKLKEDFVLNFLDEVEDEVEEDEEVYGDGDEEFQEEVEDAEPKKTPPGPKAKKKKSTKSKGRGRPKKLGRPAKRKATKKATPTKAKAKKMSKDLGLSIKDCEDLLEKYNSEDKARKSRLAKRKKAGKSSELTVSESLEKEVKTVKNKVEDKKTATTKTQAKSQGNKITELVKAILQGIDKKQDKIKQIDAIIKGLVAEKKSIMAKKGVGSFLVGTALGGYAGYKAGLSKDKTELKDLFKGEKKLAKDFKDAVKDKKKKDASYTEFEEIYAKGGNPKSEMDIFIRLDKENEKEIRYMMIGKEDKKGFSGWIIDYAGGGNWQEWYFVNGVDLEEELYEETDGDYDNDMTEQRFIDKKGKDFYTAIHKTMDETIGWSEEHQAVLKSKPPSNTLAFQEGSLTPITVSMTIFEDESKIKYVKGGVPDYANWEYPIYFDSQDKDFVAIYYSNAEDVNEADEDFDNRTYSDITPDVIKEYVDDKWEQRDVYDFSKQDEFMNDLEYALETSSISPEKVEYAKGGTTYDKSQDEKIYDNSVNIDENKEEIDHYGLASSDALGLAQENEDTIDNMRQGTNKVLNNLYQKNPSLKMAHGGKTPKFKVRKSFYDELVEGSNKKTGTGEDMRKVYHLQTEGTNYNQNYLVKPSVATKKFLEENNPGGYDEGFYVDEEVYVDFTDKDGNKKKGYMIVNNPDLAVRILRDKYNAVSIEDMLMEWEMEEKGKNFDDYTDSY